MKQKTRGRLNTAKRELRINPLPQNLRMLARRGISGGTLRTTKKMLRAYIRHHESNYDDLRKIYQLNHSGEVYEEFKTFVNSKIDEALEVWHRRQTEAGLIGLPDR